VLREREAPHRDRLPVGELGVGGEFLVARGAQHREVAADELVQLDALRAVAEFGFRLHLCRAREVFVLGDGDRRVEFPRLVEPRLVPRDERHRPPARVVAEREQRE
jgi:hypothetical protein